MDDELSRVAKMLKEMSAAYDFEILMPLREASDDDWSRKFFLNELYGKVSIETIAMKWEKLFLLDETIDRPRPTGPFSCDDDVLGAIVEPIVSREVREVLEPLGGTAEVVVSIYDGLHSQCSYPSSGKRFVASAGLADVPLIYWFPEMSDGEVLVAMLLHELRHAWQILTGRLEYNHYGVVWEGKTVPVKYGDDHPAMPHEIDANSYAKTKISDYSVLAGQVDIRLREIERVNSYWRYGLRKSLGNPAGGWFEHFLRRWKDIGNDFP